MSSVSLQQKILDAKHNMLSTREGRSDSNDKRV